MKSVCKFLTLSLLMGVTMLMPALANAQSKPAPSIVVSIANFDEQMNDVKHLLDASGFPELKFVATAGIGGYTDGLDKTKAAGVMLYFGEEIGPPDFVAFAPVTDMEAMLDVVGQMAEIDEEDDMYIIVPPSGEEVMVKEQNGYAFFSTSEDMLGDLPTDPAKSLGDLPNKYNLAAMIMPQRIPEAMKKQVMDMIKEGSQQTLENMGDDLQSDLQRKNLELQMKQFEMLMGQTDEITVGMAVDKAEGSLYMDVVFKAKAGTELAKKLANSKPTAPTRFSGFLMDKAAFTMNTNARMDDSDAKTYGDLLDQAKGSIFEEIENGDLSDDEADKVKEALGDLMDVVKATLQEGVFDGGAVVMLDGKEMNMAAGMQVADPMKVENIVKKLVPMIKEKAGDRIMVKLDVGMEKGIKFHEVIVPVPENEEEARAALGEKVTILLGIAKKDVYVAAGTNPKPVLMKAISDTQPATDLQQFNIYVAPILKTVARIDAPPEVQIMADKLAEVGKDRISVVTNLIENGTHSRFEMQEGILSLIKVGVESFQSGGFPENDF